MVGALILVIHLAAAVYAFVTRKREGGTGDGLLAVAFFAVIFSVGWTILTMTTSWLVPQEGFATWLNRDGLTLLLLTAAEAVFYFFLLRKGPGKSTTRGSIT